MRIQKHRHAGTVVKAAKTQGRAKAKSVRKTERRAHDTGPSSGALGMRQLAVALSRLQNGPSLGARGLQKLAATLKDLEPSPAAQGLRQLAAALQQLAAG